MEKSLNVLIERTTNASADVPPRDNEAAAAGYTSRQSSTEVDPAPVLMIRTAANNVLSKPAYLTEYDAQDRIAKFMQSSEASRLLLMYVDDDFLA